MPKLDRHNNADVLLLGAHGQLGTDLSMILEQHNIVTIKLGRSDFALNQDLSNQDVCQQLAHYPAVKYIINCIALTNVDACEENDLASFNINAHFCHYLAKFCAHNEITLIHLSTDYIFDGKLGRAYVENDVTRPINVYGMSKYLAELFISSYHDKYFIFRVASLFGQLGARAKQGNLITKILAIAATNAKVPVICDQIFSPTATIDVAKCIVHFIKEHIIAYGIYHCVSANYCSRFEFTEYIFKLANVDRNLLQAVAFANFKFLAPRPRFSALNVNKLSQYYQMPTWQTALEQYFSDATGNLY